MGINVVSEYIPVQLKDDQLNWVSKPEKIKRALESSDCLGFEAYQNSQRIGFALLKRFAAGKYFLWNYMIDQRYQGQGLGKDFLKLLIEKIKQEYQGTEMTTTYIYGNETAKGLYESLGFTETSVVDEEGMHEVNMVLHLRQLDDKKGEAQ